MEEPTPFPIDEIWLPGQDNPLKITTLPIISSSELQQLDRAIEKAAAQLAEFTSHPNFLLTGKLAFGNRWEPERGRALIQEILVGNFPLKIGYIEEGAKWWRGAYSQERKTIYLSAGFVQDKLAYPAGITTVILEEIGHYLDAHLDPGDARGDEGPIFAASVQSRTPERILLEENDWGALTIDGITVTVEYSAPNPISGKIIVANDERILSDTGFRKAPEDIHQFLKNVTDFFSDGEGGKFLGYSKNSGLTGTKLAQAFQEAGQEWTVSRNVPFNVETLLQYDGVFLAGLPADNEVLIDYVNRGGNVYLAGGIRRGRRRDADIWGTFLGAFGLAYESSFNQIKGTLFDATPHPIFEKVERLHQNNGNSILDLEPDNDNNLIIGRRMEQGLYAVYTVTNDQLPVTSEGLILLQEGSDFSFSHRVPVVVPEEPSVLTFNYDLTFDKTDENGINDAFEIALVGENGNSLVHTIAAGRDAFLNLTEGEGVALATGVSTDSGTVTLDLGDIAEGTKANLIFRLVNNDGDRGTWIKIEDITVTNKQLPRTMGLLVTKSTGMINEDWSLIEDVSGSLQAVYGRTSWEEARNVLYVDAQIVNQGGYEVRNNLLVAVTGISDPGVRVRDFDGVTPDGLPYYSYSKVMEDGILAPGEETGGRTIAFTNPEGVPFSYELVFLGELNRAPEFVGEPDREVVVGQEYIYTTTAVDPDGDELRYSVLVCPSGLTINQDTGEVRWSTPVVGNYTVTLAVEDGHGGRDIQTYTLQVVENVPNRPPIFTSTPVVDGNVNSIYTYAATAVDPDGDELSYSVLSGPSGLTVEGETGLVTWTPTGKQVGIQEVTLVVEDGRRGKTTQIFDVLVLPEEGNHAPIIISEPVLTAIGGETYNYDVKAVDPDGDTLTYSLIEAPQGATIEPDTGEITWFPSGEDLGEHTVTVQVKDGRGGVDQQTYILSVPGEEFIFTNDEDWLVGVLTNVNYTDSSNQLQLAQDINTPFNHIWVALSGRDTVVRIDTDHQEPDGRVTLADSQASAGAVLGEYYSRPAGRGGNPSRTTVDQNGDVWVGNRNEASGGMGSVTKLSAHPTGVTSTGIWNGRNFDVLSWSNVGGVDNNGGTSTATDSAVELYVRTAGTYNRTIAIDANNDVWVGSYNYGYGGGNGNHVLLDGETGAVLKGPIVFNPGGYGGLVDGNGVLWSASNVYSLAPYDPATKILTHIPTPGRSYGLAVDSLGNIWNTHSHHNTISKIDSAGNIIFTKSTHGAGVDRGVAITPKDNHVWVANSGGRDVSRLDNDGNLVAIITVERVPTGVAVDSNGKVWVTNRDSNSVSRIDPATNQVDLTVELGPGAYPYNYSDLTGTTVTTVTNPQGTWRVVEDSGTVNQEWGWIFWNTETEGAIPPGAGIKVEARAANDLSTLNLVDWKVYESGEALDLIGQFIEVRATLTKGRGEEGKTPVLSDLRFTTKGIAAVPNANPIITSTAPVRVSEGDTYSYQVQAEDPDGEPLVYRLLGGPTEATIDSATGLITWETSAEGEYNFSLEVDDSQGGTVTQSYTVKVAPNGLNQEPIITSIPPGEAVLGEPLVYQVMAVDGDGDVLTFSLENAVSGTNIDPITGVITWTTTEEQLGSNSVTIRVEDGFGGIATQEIDLLVVRTATNTEPEIISEPIREVQVRQLYRYDAKALDSNEDILSYDLSVAPTGATVDKKTGTIVWQPDLSAVGLNSFILRVKDGRGGVGLQAFGVNVIPANSPPIITSELPPIAALNLPSEYQIRAQDGDGNIVDYNLDIAPEGMTISDTGVIRWTPTQVGTNEIQITVTDNDGGKVSQSFVLEVIQTAVNQIPSFLSLPPTKVRLGNLYQYHILAEDRDGDPLTYRVKSGPEGITISQTGVVTWTPTASQLGTNQVVLEIDDSRGGIVQQSYTINVGTQTRNNFPEITSTPNLNAFLGEEYAYNATSVDPEGDTILWSLEKAPLGVGIDPLLGTLRWHPTVEQIGNHEIELRAIDSQGAFVFQIFTVTVRGTNLPTTILSTPGTTAIVDLPYSYQAVGTDPEGDNLTWSVTAGPADLVIDAATGRISWTPQKLGTVDVTVEVADELGAIATQTYTIEVVADAVNQAPVLTSIPSFLAYTDTAYIDQVTAEDPEGDDLRFQLLDGPDGMTIGESTGKVVWLEPILGEHWVVVGVNDGRLGASQLFDLKVLENLAPVITSSPKTSVTLGSGYSYDVVGSDPNGTPITYEVSGPDGLEIDDLGRLRWNPGEGDVGTHSVFVMVGDGLLSTSQSFDVQVGKDTTAPTVKVDLFGVSITDTGAQIADLGDEITIQVLGSDNVGVQYLQLYVDDVLLPLDGNGITSFSVPKLGMITVRGVATDLAGNESEVVQTLTVLDFDDVEAPTVTWEELPEVVSDRVQILGTITDDNFAYYTLEVAPLGGDYFEIARGEEPTPQPPSREGGEGVLGVFDATVLQNGSYSLRLTAVDLNGNTRTLENEVLVEGDLKLGNFTLSFTDLSIAVPGVPITVTRTYDSLNANNRDDFGYGWRLEFVDTDLRTSLGVDETYEQLGIRSIGFQPGDKVYVTLPGGERETFTFSPIFHIYGGFFVTATGNGGLYIPRFVSESDFENTLTVPNTLLTRNSEGEFVIASGYVYYPTDYTLTTQSGIVYEIDGNTGDLRRVIDTNGNILTFTNRGIESDTGVEVIFERDPQSRIVAVVDPAGNRVGYEYDAHGDLVAVTDREGNVTRFEYSDSRAHFLEEIIDPLGRSGVRSEYDDSGRLKRLLDVNGEAVELVYDPDNSTQTVKDVFGNPTTYVYDTRGNVLTEVDALGGVTERIYDGSNNLLSETDPLGRTTGFTYDSEGNLTTVTDPLGNTTRYTFNRFGEVLTRTNSLGETTTYTYDEKGNRLIVINAEGDTNSYTYVDGQLSKLIDAEGNVTQFEYDSNGNVTEKVDALGTVTTYTYDSAGRLVSQIQTVTNSGGMESLTTSWTYDREGRLTALTDPANGISRFEYDSLGNLLAQVSPLGQRTEFTYDEKGRLITTQFPDGSTEELVYDAGDRVIATVDRLGRRTEFIYNARDQVLETILPDATPEDLTDNPRTKQEYDLAGQLIAEIDERGNRTEYQYDLAGRPVVVTDTLGNETRHTYNAIGNRLTTEDALGRVTRFTYDTLGRQLATIFPDGTSTSFSYNSIGQRDSATDQAGRTTYYIYDELQRPVEIIFPDNTPEDLSDNPRTFTEYDNLGRITATIDLLGRRTNYQYDALGRLISIQDNRGQRTYTYDAAGNRISETDPLGRTTQWIYDSLDRPIETIYPDSTSTSTVYDAFGNPTATIDQAGRETQFEYDERNRLVAVIDALDQRTEYGYDLAGNLVEIKDANNHSTTFEYDALNRQTGTFLPLGQQSQLTYDAVGNLLTSTNFNGETINYEYDALNRLSRKTLPDNSSLSYTYTSTGQVAEAIDGRGMTTYAYDERDRLLLRTDPDGRTIRYTYNSAGNPTTVTVPSGTTEYRYDIFGRAIEVIAPDGGTTSYTYDAVDNLIRTELPNGVAENREYDDLNRLLFLEHEGSGDSFWAKVAAK